MHETLLFILLTLTTFRVSWFVTRDSFPAMRAVREWFITRAEKTGQTVRIDEAGHADPEGEYEETRGGWSWAADLITCYWCVSVWAAAGLTLLVYLLTDLLSYPLLHFGGAAALAPVLALAVDKLSQAGE